MMVRGESQHFFILQFEKKEYFSIFFKPIQDSNLFFHSTANWHNNMLHEWKNMSES